METVVGDQVCDRFPPQQQYTYRFLKTYMAGTSCWLDHYGWLSHRNTASSHYK